MREAEVGGGRSTHGIGGPWRQPIHMELGAWILSHCQMPGIVLPKLAMRIGNQEVRATACMQSYLVAAPCHGCQPSALQLGEGSGLSPLAVHIVNLPSRCCRPTCTAAGGCGAPHGHQHVVGPRVCEYCRDFLLLLSWDHFHLRNPFVAVLIPRVPKQVASACCHEHIVVAGCHAAHRSPTPASQGGAQAQAQDHDELYTLRSVFNCVNRHVHHHGSIAPMELSLST